VALSNKILFDTTLFQWWTSFFYFGWWNTFTGGAKAVLKKYGKTTSPDC
jgi:hypothetical protein